jgi:hypothetical protein
MHSGEEDDFSADDDVPSAESEEDTNHILGDTTSQPQQLVIRSATLRDSRQTLPPSKYESFRHVPHLRRRRVRASGPREALGASHVDPFASIPIDMPLPAIGQFMDTSMKATPTGHACRC